jgi:predicted DsbA family dithiol-disulfide isomerase
METLPKATRPVSSKKHQMVQKQKQPAVRNDQENMIREADGVDITYYTDPLCCWSWAFEPQWRKLQFEFGDRICFRYCMGGLIPDWKNFHDPINSISRPIQMGPVWMHAAQLSGMPIQHNIWMKDPPASSYPSCIAVKCAEMQSPSCGDKYLRLVREEAMIKGNNIAKQQVLVQVAEKLKEEFTSFDVEMFKEDLRNDRGLEAFRKDMQQVRYHDINRFPTLIIRKPQQASILISGHRPYVVLTDALNKISPGLSRVRVAESAEQYTSYWGRILPREIDEAISQR